MSRHPKAQRAMCSVRGSSYAAWPLWLTVRLLPHPTSFKELDGRYAGRLNAALTAGERLSPAGGLLTRPCGPSWLLRCSEACMLCGYLSSAIAHVTQTIIYAHNALACWMLGLRCSREKEAGMPAACAESQQPAACRRPCLLLPKQCRFRQGQADLTLSGGTNAM